MTEATPTAQSTSFWLAAGDDGRDYDRRPRGSACIAGYVEPSELYRVRAVLRDYGALEVTIESHCPKPPSNETQVTAYFRSLRWVESLSPPPTVRSSTIRPA